MICGSGGSNSRLAKAAGAEPAGQMRDEKLLAVVARSTFGSQNVESTSPSDRFGSWDVEKVHTVVAGSTFRSKHVQNTSKVGPLLEVEMLKNRMPLWRGAHFQVNMYKTNQVRNTFGSWDVEKAHGAVARSTFRSRHVKSTTCSDHFWRFRCGSAWQAQGILHLAQSEQKCYGFLAFPKTMAGVGHFKKICKGACRVAGAVQEICSSEMLFGGQGVDFLRGVAFWSIRSSGLLRWFCVTGAAVYDLAPLFRGRRNTSETWAGKIAKRVGTRLSALHSTFHFWRKSRRIASFLMLSTSKIQDVSQKQKLRKSRRIACF